MFKITQKRILSIVLSLALIFSLIGAGIIGLAAEEDIELYGADDLTGKLVIVHTNDVHGRDVTTKSSIGTAGVAQLKKDYEAKGADVLLVSAGDAIQGTPLVNIDTGASAVQFLEAAGYDLLVPGNHEFDFGTDNLLNILSDVNFDVLSANIYKKGESPSESEEPLFEANAIYEKAGMKIGVFGLTTPETLTKTHPDKIKGLNFLMDNALYERAQEQVDYLKSAGCNLIICVGHLGIDSASEPNCSTDVIGKVNGIDLFIDGHSHSMIESSVGNGRLVTQLDGTSKTLLVSAKQYLEYAGVVIYDKATKKYDAFLMNAETPPTSPPPPSTLHTYTGVDPVVKQLIDARNAVVENSLKEVIGKTEVTLYGKNTTNPKGVRMSETNLGDFAADALLWVANEELGRGTVDIAITNGGGIRDSIPADGRTVDAAHPYEITMKDMVTVFPFGNTVTVIKITGAQLLEALEAATYCTPAVVGAFPQVSAGLEFEIHTYVPYENDSLYPGTTYFKPKNPGARIQNVKVGGEPLDLAKIYSVATNDFTAAGGDTYAVFKACKAFTNLGVAMEDALIEFIDYSFSGNPIAAGSLYSAPQGRIAKVGYTISATVFSGGKVTGSGEYNSGSPVTLTATPNAGNSFIGWFEANTKISGDNTINFTAESDRTIEARFDIALTGTQQIVVEGYDWNAGVSKIILTFNERVSANSFTPASFIVNTNKQSDDAGNATSYPRTVKNAYLCDKNGNKISDSSGNIIALEMSVTPTGQGDCPIYYYKGATNTWANPYNNVITISNSTVLMSGTNEIKSFSMESEPKGKIMPEVDKFNITQSFEASDGVILPYASYIPPKDSKSHPLVIWLHGMGEGGGDDTGVSDSGKLTDPAITLLANNVTNYVRDTFQSLMGNAYVLVPQAPTYWMDDGDGSMTTGNKPSIYETSLWELIEDYVKENPAIDPSRIIIGGCSNGGYMTMDMLFLHPNYFSAAFPCCAAFDDANMTDAMIKSIKDVPIWFVHILGDEFVNPIFSINAFNRLVNAGAPNAHIWLFDHVVDSMGYAGLKDGYIEHFAWVFAHNNDANDNALYIKAGEETSTKAPQFGDRPAEKFILSKDSDTNNPKLWQWLAGKYCTVTFDLAGGTRTGGGVLVQQVSVGGAAKAPTVGGRDGYTFDGWNIAFSNVTQDIKVTAKWSSIISGGGGGVGGATYVINFNSNGGSSVSSAFVPYSGTVEKPTNPKKEGYIFTGWYTDSDCSQLYNFSKRVTTSFTLYAGWEKGENQGSTRFIDVFKSDWFCNDVEYVFGKGLMLGTANNAFSPKSNLTRAMIVTILYRLDNEPDVSEAVNPFSDVVTGQYYASAVMWAVKNEIVTGYNGRFRPNDYITRQELAAILYRYADYSDIELVSNRTYEGFSDAASIADYAKDAVEALYKAGVINGKGNNMFAPADNATRAETAAMMHRFLENAK